MQTDLAIDYHTALDRIEAEMVAIGGKDFEVADFFCGGMYIRPVLFEPGDYIVGKEHKTEHPFFLMAGTIELFTQDGLRTMTAPMIDVTPAGTRRFAKALTHVLFVCVHRTDKQTVEEVEEEVIEKRINPLIKNIN